MADLSDRDRQVLAFFRDYFAAHRRYPVIVEVGDHLGISHPNNAKRILDRLVAIGELDRTEGIARGYSLPSRTRGSSLKILGKVAAGQPIAVYDPDGDEFDFDAEFCRDGMFMLRVDGTSMIDDLIGPGDYVVIRKQPEAQTGEEVVAMVNGEMTLKVYREIRGVKWLWPCNANVEPIRLDACQDCVIIGVLVGVVRSKKKKHRR